MGETAAGTCPERGAPVAAGSTCRDNFHALLFLEADVPGGPARSRTSARWPVESWPVVVTDVLTGGVDGYAKRIKSWARSIVGTIAVPVR